MPVNGASLVTIADHLRGELCDQLFVDVIEPRLGEWCEPEQAGILAFIKLNRLWMVRAPHANFVEESLFETGQTWDLLALLQVNFALCKLCFVCALDLSSHARIALLGRALNVLTTENEV